MLLSFLKRLLRRQQMRHHQQAFAQPFMEPIDPAAPWQSERDHELNPLPRAVMIVRPKQPYANWVRKTQSRPNYTLAESRREDALAYLIPSLGPEELEEFLSNFWSHFFAQSLALWDFDSASWPPDRHLTLFKHWFDIEFESMVLDLGGWEDH